MTTSQPDPPLAPDELVATGGEREVLEAFLDLYRGIVVRKLTGLDDEQARRRLLPSLTTLAGILKHLALVEREWFQLVLTGRPLETEATRADAEWPVGADETVEKVLADYELACQQSRRPRRGSVWTTRCRTRGWARCRCAGSTST